MRRSRSGTGCRLALTTALDPINVRNGVIRASPLLGRPGTFVFDLVPVLNVPYRINVSFALVRRM